MLTHQESPLETQEDEAGVGETAGSETDIRRWLNTWIALGCVVVFVVIAFLILISNALVSINHNLGSARAAVEGADGNTKTLPGQIETVNDNLTALDTALNSIPAQTSTIEKSLKAVDANLAPTDEALRSASSQLVGVSTGLRGTAWTIGEVASGLADTSGLLDVLLDTTGSIDTSLNAINTSGAGGIKQVNAGVRDVNASLTAARRELGNVDATLVAVNRELTDICKATVINLLHGKQPC